MNLIVWFIAACTFGATTAEPPSPEELQMMSEIDQKISLKQINFTLDLLENYRDMKNGFTVTIPTADLFAVLAVLYYATKNREYRENFEKDFDFSLDSRPAELAIANFVRRSKEIEKSEGSKTAMAFFYPAGLNIAPDFKETMNRILSSNEWHFAVPKNRSMKGVIEEWSRNLNITGFEKCRRWRLRRKDRSRLVVAKFLRTEFNFLLYGAKEVMVHVYHRRRYTSFTPYVRGIAEVIYGESEYNHRLLCKPIKLKYIKVPWAGVGTSKFWTIFIISSNDRFEVSRESMERLLEHALLNTNVSVVRLLMPKNINIYTEKVWTKKPYAYKSEFGLPSAFSGSIDYGRMFTEEASEVSNQTNSVLLSATRNYALTNVTERLVGNPRVEFDFIVDGHMKIMDVSQEGYPIIQSVTNYVASSTYPNCILNVSLPRNFGDARTARQQADTMRLVGDGRSLEIRRLKLFEYRNKDEISIDEGSLCDAREMGLEPLVQFPYQRHQFQMIMYAHYFD